MKYVYVLASCEHDDYYEQFLLSLASFRLYNPNAAVIALIDEKTKQNLNGKRSRYEEFISETKIINVPLEYSQKEASRWIKTSVQHYISGDFLYIDCDTIIAEKLDYDFPSDIAIGAVLDTHVTLEYHHLKNHFNKEDKKLGFSSSFKSNNRFNGGLLYCRNDSPARDFYEKWHSLWIESRKNGCSQDMPSLNQANYELGGIIAELNGEWNCQISHNGLPWLANAKIIHYYATSLSSLEPAYKLASSAVINSLKETGEISPEILMYIKKPKNAFDPFSRIISDKSTIHALDKSLLFKSIRFFKRHGKS
ncbi:MAG: glycosyltransferase [Treponema sp.]|nr:glycosyltransferase [Treponema sp.]